MFEYSAELASATPSLTLWLIPFVPLAATFLALLRPERKGWLFAAAVLCAAVAGAHLAWLWSLPANERALIAYLGTAIRIGSLDVTWTLLFDPLSGFLALAIALVAAAALAGPVRSKDPGVFVAVGLATSGALLAVLADGVATLLVGWSIVAIGAWLARADDNDRSFAVARFGELGVLGGFVIVTWGLGGAFGEGGTYSPDFRPRLVAVEALDATDAPNDAGSELRRGRLTMSALPGARVLLGDADLCAVDAAGRSGGVGTPAEPCRLIARTPFAGLELPAAMYQVRVIAGVGTHDLRVETVRIRSGRTTHLALTGPTLVFREIAQQLMLRDSTGAYAVVQALHGRRIWGLPLLEVGLVLVALGLAARASLFPFGGAQAPASGEHLAQVVAGYVALRLAALFSLSPFASFVLALLALLALIVAAESIVRVGSASDLGRAVVALALLAVAVGAFTSAVAVLITLPPAVALLSTAQRAGQPLVARLAALAIAAAPIPLVGGFGARESLVWTAFRQQAASYLPGLLVALVVLGGFSALAFGAWRIAYGVAAKGRPKKQTPRRSQGLLVLAGLTLAAGLPALALDALGGSEPSALAGWLASSFAPADPRFAATPAGLRYVLLVAGFALATAAWFAARRRRVRPPRQAPAVAGRSRVALGTLAERALTSLSRAVARVDAVLEGRSQERS